MITINKLKNKIYEKTILFFVWKTNPKKYMMLITKYLKKLGINIGVPSYIDLTVWIDCVDYSLITIEDDVVISRDVSILVHDYSISNALIAKNIQLEKPCNLCHNVIIGKNTFIGFGSTLLPGTKIGENCIIGAGSVVKGYIEPYSIMVGNPAKKIGDVRDWADKKIEESQYVRDCIRYN